MHSFKDRTRFLPKNLVAFGFVFVILMTVVGFAQVKVARDSLPPEPSAGLDVSFSNKGFLPPRMTYEQRNAIPDPAEGLIIYCTNCRADASAAISIFSGGKWLILTHTCEKPAAVSSGIHSSGLNQITWKWNTVPIAWGYKWNTINDTTGAINVGNDTVFTESGLICTTRYLRYLWAYNECGISPATTLVDTTTSLAFPSPVGGAHAATSYQIIWNWNPVEGATGYRWNTVNNYNTAIDVGPATSRTELGLNCGQVFTRFVWAYSQCAISEASPLTTTSAECPPNCLPLTDIRNNKTYATVLIGSQCWMKENINIGTMISGTANQTNNSIIEKYCYANDTNNCRIYGGLYQWDEFMNYSSSSSTNPSGRTGICPAGWHIPSDAEYTQLINFIGTDAGGKMKEAGTARWLSPNTGATNASAFTGLPAGFRNSGGSFADLTTYAYFWSATENSTTNSWIRRLL